MTETEETGGTAGTTDESAAPLLKVRGLVRHFPITKGLLKRQVGAVQAVDGIDFEVRPGRPWAWSASPAAASRRWAG